jgi:hypothetical protein
MQIYREAKTEIDKTSAHDIGQIVEITKNSYVKIRNRRLDEEILGAALLNLQNFYQLNQAMAPSISAAFSGSNTSLK